MAPPDAVVCTGCNTPFSVLLPTGSHRLKPRSSGEGAGKGSRSYGARPGGACHVDRGLVGSALWDCWVDETSPCVYIPVTGLEIQLGSAVQGPGVLRGKYSEGYRVVRMRSTPLSLGFEHSSSAGGTIRCGFGGAAWWEAVHPWSGAPRVKGFFLCFVFSVQGMSFRLPVPANMTATGGHGSSLPWWTFTLLEP